MSRKAMWLLTLMGFVTVFLTGWVLMYPSLDDSNNIQYVLWKAGFPTMDVDRAAGTMIGDRYRDRIVLGKTKEQLRGRFGDLETCRKRRRPGEAVTFLQVGPAKKCSSFAIATRIIVFDGDRASELVLIKGCCV